MPYGNRPRIATTKFQVEPNKAPPALPPAPPTDEERRLELLAEIQEAIRRDEYFPQPKQRLAHDALDQGVGELLYGGARGGGKTRFVLEHVIDQCERYPGNRWLILRRILMSLTRSILPRLKLMLKGRAVYNANARTFTFPNESVIELGSIQYDDDAGYYQGAEYGGILYEELTEFTFEMYDIMRGVVRAPVDGVHATIIGTTNPINEGLQWVRKRFIRPNEDEAPMEPFKIWQPGPTEEDPLPTSRVFIPATLDDNPALEIRDPRYRHNLEGLSDPRLRRAFLLGDWEAMLEVPGALWEWSMITPHRLERPESLGRLYVGFDPAGTDKKTSDEHGIVACGRTGDQYYVLADRSGRYDVDTAARVAVQLYEDMRADAIIVEHNYGGDWIPANIAHIDPTVRVESTSASRGKILRARPIITPYADGRVHHCGEFLELETEMTSFVENPKVRRQKSPNRLDALVFAMTALGAPSQYIDWDAGLDWAWREATAFN